VLAVASVAVVLLAASGCRLSRRDETAAPVAAVDGTAARGSNAPAVDLYAGTQPAAGAAGRVVTGTIPTPDGRIRSYRLYVPASLADGAAAPLLVALHGGGGSAEQFERSSGLDGLAESNRFLVAYPDGIGLESGARLRTWNAGTCCGAAVEQKVDDVGFVRRLIDTVRAARPVIPGHVYAIGHSNGGMLGYRIACELADQVAAVGIQSGTLAVASCQPAAPVSLLHLHGTADENVPIEGGTGTRGVSGADHRPAQPSATTVARADGCTDPPVTAVDGGNPDLTISTWAGCAAGTGVSFVAVAGASHAWMGHDRGPLAEGLVGEPYPDLDASRALWAFVSAHPRA
jgi:polyhydroxybutyrate depolymerase